MKRIPHRDESEPGGWAGLQWIDTTEVVAGDRLACLLSDAKAFPKVLSWSDRHIDLTRYGLGITIYRDFTVAPEQPWWLDDKMLSNEREGRTLIVDRSWL